MQALSCKKVLSILLLSSMLNGGVLFAQEKSEEEIGIVDKPPSPEEELKEEAREKSEVQWGAAAMPILAYTPEYGGMFGAAGLLYRLPPKGESPEKAGSDPSTIMANAIWTTNEAVLAGIMGDASVFDDSIKVEMAGEGVFVPTYFWGIGPNAYDRESYTLREYSFVARTGFKILGSFYGGPMYEYGLITIVDKEQEGELEARDPLGSSGATRVSGIGFRLFWDSTKGGLFPFDGLNATLTTKLFRQEFGSSSDFTLMSFDGRGYINTFFSHVAALQFLYQQSTGEPPFQLLPSIGGEESMRGYYKGRFRDETALSLRGEYRAPLTERIGLVGFVSVGQVGPSLSELSSKNLKVAGGGGFRLTLQKKLRLNLRVDIAYSEEGVFPYVNVSEVF